MSKGIATPVQVVGVSNYPCDRATPATFKGTRAKGMHPKGCRYVSDADRRRIKTERRRAAARRVSKRANR